MHSPLEKMYRAGDYHTLWNFLPGAMHMARAVGPGP